MTSFRRPLAFLAMALVLAVGCSLTAQPAEKIEVSPVPIPSWVEPIAWEVPTKSPPIGTPAELLLSDGQSRLTPGVGDYFQHTVVRLQTSEGVRNHAEVSVVYAPEYQSVAWHKLTLVRDGATIDLLKTAKFSRLRRELGFEAKTYDGQYTLAAVLDDIRVGDILETAYTLTDSNPIWAGHISSRYAVGAGYPVRRQRVIVRVPAEVSKPAWYFWVPRGTSGLPDEIFRQSRLRLGLKEEVSGSERVYRWEAENISAISFDPGISPQAAPYYPMIRCSSFTTWSSVANWASPLFAKAGSLPAGVTAQVAVWKRTLSPAEQLRAAVDWAQGNVRYFAMAMGPNNLQPRALTEICSSRFGDCKDKTVLLVALLRELGLEAWPALVNSYSPQRVEDGGPDQFAFNHAIVAYKYQGFLHWIDPTMKQPAGNAGDWEVPPYRLALVLRSDEPGLTAIAGRPLAEPDTTVADRVVLDAASGDGELITEMTIRGLQADHYRQYFESTAPGDVAKYWFNYIARFHRRLQELSPPEVADDRARNVLTVRARYRLPGIMKKEGGRATISLYAYALRTLLEPPETRRRSWPYPLPTDRFVRHRFEMDLPFPVPVDQRPQVITGPGIEYRAEKSLANRRFRASHDLIVTGAEVAASDMEKFCDAADEILADLNTSVTQPAPEAAASPASAGH